MHTLQDGNGHKFVVPIYNIRKAAPIQGSMKKEELDSDCVKMLDFSDTLDRAVEPSRPPTTKGDFLRLALDDEMHSSMLPYVVLNGSTIKDVSMGGTHDSSLAAITKGSQLLGYPEKNGSTTKVVPIGGTQEASSEAATNGSQVLIV
jgi:hypothetical protein